MVIFYANEEEIRISFPIFSFPIHNCQTQLKKMKFPFEFALQMMNLVFIVHRMKIETRVNNIVLWIKCKQNNIFFFFIFSSSHRFFVKIVRMSAIYEAGKIPFISGRAVNGKYLFHSIRFLFQPKTATKAHSPIQHRINGRTFEMEMQLFAENEVNGAHHSMENHRKQFIVVSYFFTVAMLRCYSFEPLIKCLKYIRQPSALKTIKKSFPLDRCVYRCGSGLYGYLWQYNECDIHHFIEANHLIPIGITQMNEFYKLAHHNHTHCASNGSVQIENQSSDTNAIYVPHLVHYSRHSSFWNRTEI